MFLQTFKSEFNFNWNAQNMHVFVYFSSVFNKFGGSGVSLPLRTPYKRIPLKLSKLWGRYSQKFVKVFKRFEKLGSLH